MNQEATPWRATQMKKSAMANSHMFTGAAVHITAANKEFLMLQGV